jgi:hypothetical protein
MSESAELTRRQSGADRLLAKLQDGPATNLELIHVVQRISGRVEDLRKRGWLIDCTKLQPGVFRYELKGQRELGRLF